MPWPRTPGRVEGVRYIRSRALRSSDLVAGALAWRTTVAHALIDEASRSNRDHARTLVAMAVQQRSTTPYQVRSVLRRMGPVRQSVLLHTTLDDVEGGSHSLPELRFLDVIRASDLPLPDRQVVRRRPDGRYYLDAGRDRYRLAAEIDGSHHRDVGAWEADVLRQDELVVGDVAVIRLLSWWVRDRPQLVLDLLRRALLSRGWRP